MKNLFERTSSNWVRYSEYEWKAAEDGTLYPVSYTHLDVYKRQASRGVRPEEIMAIGDSENDYSMLSMDIKYTVAMGNAMESIKRTAKCQTRSNIQDGVAYAIETLVLTREARAY